MTTVKAGEQLLNQQMRDKTFATMRYQKDNNICIDCEKKNPKWASIYLGIHLCIDCAGKHRQYGVTYSFIKSTNLDAWNRKQLLFMQKGSNARALEYFKKCGVINESNKHIDYKSPIVQKYKQILTQQVQSELSGKTAKTQAKSDKKIDDFFQQMQKTQKTQKPVQKIQISNSVEVVKEQTNVKTKKNKKKMAQKINIDDFQNMVFDDGIPIQEKQKMMKNNQAQKIQSFNETSNTINNQEEQKQPIKQQSKQLSQQQVKKKMEELKGNQNIKSISSDQFKDNSIDNVVLKQNLNKFSGSASISSDAFFGEDSNTQQTSGEKIKQFVSNAGGKIYDKLSGLSSYWKKS